MAKITKATFRAFVNKNRKNLMIRCESGFDAMTDCVEQEENPTFRPVKEVAFDQNTLGISGVWLVGSSRDFFRPFDENGLIGISVHNCCGSFTVAGWSDDEPDGAGREIDTGAVSSSERAEIDRRKKGGS